MAMVKRTNQMLNGETPTEANMRKIQYEQEKTLEYLGLKVDQGLCLLSKVP